MTLAIGLTGGIGGGKSDLLRLFRNAGASVIEADTLAREMMNTHQAIRRRLTKEFGERMYGADGLLDRKTVARLLFTDDAARSKIDAIVHPVVIDEIAGRIRKEKELQVTWGVVVEAALVYEAHVEEMFDYVVVVTASQSVRISRLMARDGLSEEEARIRIGAQMTEEEKCARADFVLHNNGSTAELASRFSLICMLLRSLAAAESKGVERE